MRSGLEWPKELKKWKTNKLVKCVCSPGPVMVWQLSSRSTRYGCTGSARHDSEECHSDHRHGRFLLTGLHRWKQISSMRYACHLFHTKAPSRVTKDPWHPHLVILRPALQFSPQERTGHTPPFRHTCAHVCLSELRDLTPSSYRRDWKCGLF